MKKIQTLTIITLLLLLALISSSILADENQTNSRSISPDQYEQAYRYNVQGWIYLYIQGEPYERGYQHGYLLSAEIVDTIHRWSNVIHNHPKLKPLTGDISSPRYEKVSERWWNFCKSRINKMYWNKYPDEYRKEIQGIADGVTGRGGRVFGKEITCQDILAINEMYELMTKLENQIKGVHPLRTFVGSLKQLIPGLPTSFADTFISTILNQPKTHHCSAFIASGDATSQGQLVATHVTQCGGWWFTYYIAQRWNVILDIQPTSGNRILMTTSPGYIWSDENYYQNSNGIIVLDTTVPQGLWRRTGLPFAIRTRKAAQYSNSIDDAIYYLKSQNDGVWTAALLFGDTKTGEIARLDLGLYKSKVWRTSDGYYYSANNLMDMSVRAEANRPWLKGFLLKLVNSPGYVFSTIRFYPNFREEKIIELAEKFYGKIDVDVVKEMVSTSPLENTAALDCKITDTALVKDHGLWAFFGYLSGGIWDVSSLKNIFKDVKDVPPMGWVLIYGLPSNFDHQLTRQPIDESAGGEQVLWTVPTNKENNTEYSQSTVSDDVVYSATTSGMIYAIRTENGKILWEKELGGNTAIAPLIYQDILFIGSDSGVYALEKKGEMNWSNLIGHVVSPPVANDNVVFVGTVEGVHALTFEQGEVLWEYPTGYSAYLSTPWNDIVFVGSGKGCYALDCKEWEMKWVFEVNAPITSSPTVSEGTVYVGCWDGNLYALDADDGKLKWQYQTGWGIDTTPVVKNDVIFFGSMDNNLYALDAEGGELLWVFSTQAGIHSSSVVYGDYVFFGSDDGTFYAANITTGELAWSFSPGYRLENDVFNYITTPILSDPIIDNGRIIIGIKGNIFALDTQTNESAKNSIGTAGSKIPLGTWLFIAISLAVIISLTSLYLYWTRKSKQCRY